MNQFKFDYERTFAISAAHFNGARAYEVATALFGKDRPHPPSDRDSAVSVLTDMARELATSCHGHNFKITIVVGADALTPEGYVVSDLYLSEVVNQWDATNLSLHDDFWPRGLRATTENMALVLWDKLAPNVVEGRKSIWLSVRVEETPDQVATLAGHFAS